jgi:hypothetical protein
LKFLLAVALAAFAMQAVAQRPVEPSEWEKEQERRNWKEGGIKLPAYPRSEGLIEFEVVGGSFRFFIDPDSLAVGPDGVVRYTLVARSPSGYANISYEGIRCSTRTYKVFAFGNDGKWTERNTDWRPTESKSVQSSQYELRVNYFCPDRQPIETVAEGLDALRSRGHPKAKITRYH